jgi:hypothetical protein
MSIKVVLTEPIGLPIGFTCSFHKWHSFLR